jgi:hypothetical protein
MDAQGKLRGDDSGKYSLDWTVAQLHFAWFLPSSYTPLVERALPNLHPNRVLTLCLLCVCRNIVTAGQFILVVG